MKLRTGRRDNEIELQMTPMIDIVFQLLAFFIITFKVVAMEGDFNIKMPLASQSTNENFDFNPVINIKLLADDNGNTADIIVKDTQRFGNDFEALREYMVTFVGDTPVDDFAEPAEVEFDCDANLNYEEVIKAVTAVSGYKKDNEIVTLVEKIRFKDSDGGPSF